jgi:hypothetical protein
MSKSELERLVDDKTISKVEMQAIVSEAVHQTLVQMGVDVSSPLDMQRDFQHLRDWRMAQEAIKRKGYLAMASILVTGFVALLWIGFKHFLVDLLP